MKSTSALRHTCAPSSLASCRTSNRTSSVDAYLAPGSKAKARSRKSWTPAANLRDLDDLLNDVGQAGDVFVGPERAAEHQHDGGERRLRDVRPGVEARRAVDVLGCADAELLPELSAAISELRQRAAIDAVEQHDLSGGGEHDARRRDRAVREAETVVQPAKRRQKVEQESQSRVHTGDMPEVSRGVE
jgi:hypothetical protein